MKKLFIITIIVLVATHVLACAVEPITPPPPTPGSTVIDQPTVISTADVTPGSTPTTSPIYPPAPGPKQAASPVPKLIVEEVKQKIDSGSIFILVDVRSKADYDQSHIVGAVSIPIQELFTRYAEISQDS